MKVGVRYENILVSDMQYGRGGDDMFLAIKELGQSKVRYSLISLIMIAILFLVFFITGLANGLSFADSSSLQNLKADYVVMNEEADGAIIQSELTQEQITSINNQIARKSTPLSITMSAIIRGQKKALDVAYFSIDTKNYADIKIIEG